MLSSISSLHHTVDDKKPSECKAGVAVDGFFQLILTCLVLGWVWSIGFGIAIYRKSRDAHLDHEEKEKAQ